MGAIAYAGPTEPPVMRYRFALPDDDEGGSDGGADGLTHMGRPLADVRDAFGALAATLSDLSTVVLPSG